MGALAARMGDELRELRSRLSLSELAMLDEFGPFHTGSVRVSEALQRLLTAFE
eukprot:CAMPEP_0198433124 /NCGR_PEP_ID=MMETSP1452-20131203/25419_1 /TAXON_ID=1181717 /ORGANISM="Synchroma pusillum, Strain CCMP3072" /LENGTH=52 /DNA_ID=CAMNT_0044153617 /DNA_START=12 /DNA_END=167 /DNA_ORIENTATION=+